MQTKQNSHLEVDQGKKKLESTPSNEIVETSESCHFHVNSQHLWQFS